MTLEERDAGGALFRAQLHAQVGERRGISDRRPEVSRAAGTNPERACAGAGQQAAKSFSTCKLSRHECFP
jgi:hypothetical protein